MTLLPLGRREPTDWKHVEKYPLTALRTAPENVPVAIGVNWYTAFDVPTKDAQGVYWIGLEAKKLGAVRGGHCVCLKPQSITDGRGWWKYYDQGTEGACVGFGSSRMMSLLNRRRYDARWLYHQAQIVDGYPDTPPAEGTSVRAALDVLRTQGHVFATSTAQIARLSEGITANRWARTVTEVLTALGTPGAEYVDVLNSWGAAYPKRVRMPAATLQRLLDEGGEAGIVTDR